MYVCMRLFMEPYTNPQDSPKIKVSANKSLKLIMCLMDASPQKKSSMRAGLPIINIF